MVTQTQIDRARQTDLLGLVEPDTTLIHIAHTNGGEYAGPCPFCGGADRFHVQPGTGKWYCRHCTPRGGDAIDYVRRRARLTFPEAIAYLVGPPADNAARPARVRPTPQPAPPPEWATPAWQQAAQTLVGGAETALATGARARVGRAYLAGRDLQPATWQAWRLGYTLIWHPVRREELPAITLPWFGTDGAVEAIQYRYFGPGLAKRDRFGQKAGGQRLLFGRQMLAGRPILIITEGELNAISCWQVAQSWADVLSIGPQEGARQSRVIEALKIIALPYRQVIVWLDEREMALAVAERIAPFKGIAVWSKNGLDANDLLQRDLLADRLANAVADLECRM